MGDRGQVTIRPALAEHIATPGEAAGAVYLYTHWGAAELAETVRRGCNRGRFDVSYLAANIFKEMVKDEIDSSLGYGIAAGPVDGWRTVEITTRDGDGERVRVLDSGYDGGLNEGEPARVVIDLPIREFAARDRITLERCPMCRAWSDLETVAHWDEDKRMVGFRCDRCGRDFLYASGDRIFTRGPDGIAEEVDPTTGTTINHETAAQARTVDRGGPDGFWADADIISTYSRAQALADGVLFDVSDLGREAGFTVPVAITAGLMATVRAIEEGSGESEAGRLWDVINVLKFSARSGQQRTDFTVSIGGADVDLYAVIGPGDDPRPVITILLVGED